MHNTALEPHQRAHLYLEGAGLLALALWLFAGTETAWWVFAVFLLAPDLSALGYLAGNRLGAWTYNIAHNAALPIALLILGTQNAPALTVAGAIWLAHIGMDRAVGYGFKSLTGFKRTHLSGAA